MIDTGLVVLHGLLLFIIMPLQGLNDVTIGEVGRGPTLA